MEVDLVIETGFGQVAAVECKSALTPAPDALTSPLNLARIMQDIHVSPSVVFGGDVSQQRSNGTLLLWRDFASGGLQEQRRLSLAACAAKRAGGI